jgi:hypothetical protein
MQNSAAAGGGLALTRGGQIDALWRSQQGGGNSERQGTLLNLIAIKEPGQEKKKNRVTLETYEQTALARRMRHCAS